NMLRTAKQSITGDKIKVLAFHKELLALMKELQIAPEYASRYMNVGFSGGEKKRNEILQLLTLKPKLALLDETDSGLDVDAVEIVSRGVAKFHNAENSCIIITHNAQILKHLPVNRAHIFLNGRIVQSGGAELVNAVAEHGYAPFEVES
ncbi:MAG: ABC transporter ATP-binding protein, partial [Selenomonadaceae bacterium]|nr:ABC transporter ATP-binding protein [Selenomonadaceae bacterium]